MPRTILNGNDRFLILSWNEVLSDDGTQSPCFDPYELESFDGVVVDQCLEYLVLSAGQRCLASVVPLLKVGGWLQIRFLDRDTLIEKWPVVKSNPRKQKEDFFNLIYASHGPRRAVRKNLLSACQVQAMTVGLGLEINQHRTNFKIDDHIQYISSSDLSCLSFVRTGKPCQNALPSSRLIRRKALQKVRMKLDGAARYALRVSVCIILRVVPGRGRRANLGCGSYPLPLFWNVDARNVPWIDYCGGLFEFLESVPNTSLQQVHLSHVLEHLTYDEAGLFLQLVKAKLIHGGHLDIAVPDFDAVMTYVKQEGIPSSEKNEAIRSCLFGGQTYYDNYHLYAYTFATLQERLSECGFRNAIKVETFSRWPFWDSAELTRLGNQSGSLNVRVF
jgi:predicted SAM-dependent methyltransferase